MYDQIEECLIESNIAVQLPKPVWMNEKGEVVGNECESYGCKVAIDIRTG